MIILYVLLTFNFDGYKNRGYIHILTIIDHLKSLPIIDRLLMDFVVENKMYNIEVSALVDGKEIRCSSGTTTTIKGEKVELYLTHFRDAKKPGNLTNYTINNDLLHSCEAHSALCDWEFLLNPTRKEQPAIYANFELVASDGKLIKVTCWTDDGKCLRRDVKYSSKA